MRKETKRRLDQVLRRERWKKVGWVAAAVVGVAAVLVLTDLDARVDNRAVAGVVERVGTLNSKNAAQGLEVDVALENGHHVQVIALRTTDPHVGDHVSIVEHRHGTGRVTYTWK